jgi:hypothetical protein
MVTDLLREKTKIEESASDHIRESTDFESPSNAAPIIQISSGQPPASLARLR